MCLCVHECILVDHQFAHGEFSDLCSFPCSYLCGPEATGVIRHIFIHAGHCQNPEMLPDSWAMAPIQTSIPKFALCTGGKKESNIDSIPQNKLQRKFL